jgi:hypothetical protein
MQIAVLWLGAAGWWGALMSQLFAVVGCRLAASARPSRMAAAANTAAPTAMRVICQPACRRPGEREHGRDAAVAGT